jgi:transcription elongation factor Elf1
MDNSATQPRIVFPVAVACPYCGKEQDLEPTTEDHLTTQLFGCVECEELFAVAFEFTVATRVYWLRAASQRRRKG